MGSNTCSNSFWMRDEDKAFENALAIYSDDRNLWEKIAAAVPGRTLEEIKIHYEILVADVNAIELGLIPLPRYADSIKKSRKLLGHVAVDRKGKRSKKSLGESNCRGISVRSNRDRKRGRPWSEEEHRLFLHGLGKYERGDWRSISRLCVHSWSPSQVPSHAQKYFKRKFVIDKRTRSSIDGVTILDDGKILAPTTQLVARASGHSLRDTKLYSSVKRVGGGYLHACFIDSQHSQVPSSKDTSTGIDLLESLLDSLADIPTPQGSSNQQVSESASINLCTPVNANQHISNYNENEVSNSQGPIIGEVIGTAERPQVLNSKELSAPIRRDFGGYAPPSPTASQLTLESLPSDIEIRGLFPYPSSSRFEMDSPDYEALVYNELDNVAISTYPAPPSN